MITSTGFAWLDALNEAGLDMDAVTAMVTRGLVSHTPNMETCIAIIDCKIVAKGYRYPTGHLWVEYVIKSDGTKQECYWSGDPLPTND